MPAAQPPKICSARAITGPTVPGMVQAQVSAQHRAFALELARASGEFIRPFFARQDLAVELKADRTIVTAADRGAEQLMREMIARAFPDHGILGEEFGPERTDAEYVWVLDPVDGTISFAAGVPLFGTLIALQHRGHPVLGIIHQPILNELVVGDSVQTTCNGRPVRCNSTARVEDALVMTSGLNTIRQHRDLSAFLELAHRARMFRMWGDCYGYLMVATGRADVMADPIMNPWDLAALIPVIRGAGGVITDWNGRDPVGANSIVAAATKKLHTAAIEALNPG
jgi:histidinol phosphatase-like enzyme (inositol monophosphatase family)